jgi:hypothetical protein
MCCLVATHPLLDFQENIRNMKSKTDANKMQNGCTKALRVKL